MMVAILDETKDRRHTNGRRRYDGYGMLGDRRIQPDRRRHTTRILGVGLMVKAVNEGVRDMLASLLGRWILAIVSGSIVMFASAAYTSNISAIKERIEMQSALVALKGELTLLRQDSSSIKDDVRSLRTELKEVEIGTAVLRANGNNKRP